MDFAKLTDSEEEQVGLFTSTHNELSSTFFCLQKETHCVHFKYILEHLRQGNVKRICPAIQLMLQMLRENVNSKRLASVITYLTSQVGPIPDKMRKAQQKVIKEYERRQNTPIRSPQDIWYETDLIKTKLNQCLTQVTADHKSIQMHLRAVKAKLMDRTDLQRLSKPIPPFFKSKKIPLIAVSEIVELRAEAFRKIISSTKPLLLNSEHSSHYLFASLTVDAIFKSFPELYSQREIEKWNSTELQNYTAAVNELVTYYKSCLDTITDSFDINEMMVMLISFNPPEATSTTSKFAGQTARCFKLTDVQEELISLGEKDRSIQHVFASNDISLLAFQANANLQGLYRKAQQTLHDRNMDAFYLNHMTDLLDSNSTQNVQLFDNIEVPSVLSGIKQFLPERNVAFYPTANNREDKSPDGVANISKKKETLLLPLASLKKFDRADENEEAYFPSHQMQTPTRRDPQVNLATEPPNHPQFGNAIAMEREKGDTVQNNRHECESNQPTSLAVKQHGKHSPTKSSSREFEKKERSNGSNELTLNAKSQKQDYLGNEATVSPLKPGSGTYENKSSSQQNDLNRGQEPCSPLPSEEVPVIGGIFGSRSPKPSDEAFAGKTPLPTNVLRNNPEPNPIQTGERVEEAINLVATNPSELSNELSVGRRRSPKDDELNDPNLNSAQIAECEGLDKSPSAHSQGSSENSCSSRRGSPKNSINNNQEPNRMHGAERDSLQEPFSNRSLELNDEGSEDRMQTGWNYTDINEEPEFYLNEDNVQAMQRSFHDILNEMQTENIELPEMTVPDGLVAESNTNGQ